jgi:hypothetical protein
MPRLTDEKYFLSIYTVGTMEICQKSLRKWDTRGFNSSGDLIGTGGSQRSSALFHDIELIPSLPHILLAKSRWRTGVRILFETSGVS